MWAYKPLRNRHQLITRPKAFGGMGLPDFQKYYFATQITRNIDWHCHSSSKDWVQFESDVAAMKVQLSPLIPWSSCLAQLKIHPLIGTILWIFHRIAVQYKISRTPGPLTPLIENPEFLTGSDNPWFTRILVDKPVTATQFFTKGEFKLTTKLTLGKSQPPPTFWTYLQIHN